MEPPDVLNTISWSSIPSDILRAELARRQDDHAASEKPACGSGDRGAYAHHSTFSPSSLSSRSAHSVCSCGFPLFSRQTSSKGSRRSKTIIFLSQHFGTGVLIATAFVHLLPTAFVSLTDPCLPDFFSTRYQPTAGLVAMISALVVVTLESYLTTRGAGHSHAHHHGWESEDGESEDGVDFKSQPNGGLAAKRVTNHRPADIALDDVGASRGLMTDVSPLPETTPTIVPPQQNGKGLFSSNKDGHDDDDDDDDDLELNLNELDPATHEHTRPLTHQANHRPQRRASEADLTPEPLTPEEQRRRMLQCVLLEAGILFHSIFIGMAVSVATGPPFVVFLIAIAFHQTFEGLALGSRIAALQFPRSSIRPWLMVLAYGTTTPLGQAIGLGVHTLYDPKSQTGLLMVGFMNAISSGLLLFAGLVQLLAEDFLTEKSYRTLKGKKRRNAGLAVFAGASLMALVGAFA
ncbi:hypothetical protein NUW58_g7032 [Xylaria curta]|uniref:Uncharacterized protein n=1 Tax=Xylaria curta TaxID=42375 RepID=A0ACC1NNF9_9PEZI|nr:hypothetical protein NUW58_g7032 [Xylaria curta]